MTLTIHLPETAGQRLRGLIRWKGSQEDLDALILSADHAILEASRGWPIPRRQQDGGMME